MIFRRAIQRYSRTEPVETPYARAGQLWDERLGSARAQAFNWRRLAFGELALCMGLSAALVWQSAQSRIIPYVVEVDHLGEARSVAPALRNWAPNEAQIAWQLGRYIRDVRSVSLDPVVTRQNWLDAYAMTTQQGAQFLSGQAHANDPFAEAGTRATSVQVTSVVRISSQSFQVKWLETHFERSALVERSHWTGVLTIKLITPRSAQILRQNPLGVYVDGIDWSREWGGDDGLPAGASAPRFNPTKLESVP
jgi:type IV secretion system protein VirB5